MAVLRLCWAKVGVSVAVNAGVRFVRRVITEIVLKPLERRELVPVDKVDVLVMLVNTIKEPTSPLAQKTIGRQN